MKVGPPGWRPEAIITSRTDGWLGDADHMPPAVAKLIARNKRQLGDGDTVADIYARALARHQMMLRRAER